MREYRNSLLASRAFIVKLFFVFGIALASLFLYTNKVSAEQFSWATSQNPSVVYSQNAQVQSNDCIVRQTTEVAGETVKKEVCISALGTVKFGTYDDKIPHVTI